MTTDIVERLREYVENIRGHDEPPENYMCWQAADEIERLEKRVKQLLEISAVEMSKRDDEIERLRAKAERFGVAYENEVVATRDLRTKIERLEAHE